ncbi:N-acetylmuramoyl-L-alanine amidase [Desulfitobacterium hafniense]|nr:N-acetylmuramoyl-L-alanine amidase [Desulfitobacterium hafniense]
MITAQKKICILALVCMIVSLILSPASALASDVAAEQKVTIYYPNGDWGLTPVEIELSVNKNDNIHLLALQQLTTPEFLPAGCYDEFPESFNVENVRIVKNTAYVTLSETAITDLDLSESWFNTLKEIVAYNLFYLDKEIDSVEFLNFAHNTGNISKVQKKELLSMPSVDAAQFDNTLKMDLDYESLSKMSEEERYEIIQDAINKKFAALSSYENFTVCIDPGHGGTESGAVVNGVLEKNLNLTMALAMRNYLQNFGSSTVSFNVIMTRTSDTDVTLTQRHNIANNAGAEVFISIHCNTFSDPNVRGVTARYPNNHDVNLSIDLANYLISSITPSPFPKHSNASYQSIQILRNTTMPATLVECGFMTNSSDLAIIQSRGSDIGRYMGMFTAVWCQAEL